MKAEQQTSNPRKQQNAENRVNTNGVHAVTPRLVCAGAAKAIEFYKNAFGATELIRLPGPDGKLMHACLSVNGSSVMLCDEYPQMGNVSPRSLNGTPVTIHLTVADVDSFVERAAGFGVKVIMPVADMFWGDRYGVIEDPFGHRWSIATAQRPAMTESELREAARTAMAASNVSAARTD